MRGRIAVLFAASIALSGCGRAEPSSAQVRSIVRQYYAALESGNGAKICSLLTGEVRGQIVRTFSRTLRQHGIDCAKVITPSAKAQAHDATALRELRSTRIGAVTLMGNRATVVVTGPRTGAIQAPLVKTAEGWRIDELFFQAAGRKAIGG